MSFVNCPNRYSKKKRHEIFNFYDFYIENVKKNDSENFILVETIIISAQYVNTWTCPYANIWMSVCQYVWMCEFQNMILRECPNFWFFNYLISDYTKMWVCDCVNM